MQPKSLIRLFTALSLLALVLPATAQSDRGFAVTARAMATAEEIAQTGLWVMQVDFKPVRLIQLDLPDPDTGEMRQETIYYIVYRAQNTALHSPPKDDSTTPVNSYDKPPGPPLFIPELTLVSSDQSKVVAYNDVILPKAQQLIAQREMRGPLQGIPLKNSVEVIQAVPEVDDENAKPIYGVAMFRGVDPKIDHFNLYAAGFTNGFREIKGPNGNPLVLRREILLDIWRPGDEFDLDEREFRYDAQPRWILRAEDAPPADLGRDATTGEPIEEEPVTDAPQA